MAIICTNAGILLIGPLETNFSEILIGIQTFSFKEMPLKMSSAKWRPYCLGHNVLKRYHTVVGAMPYLAVASMVRATSPAQNNDSFMAEIGNK